MDARPLGLALSLRVRPLAYIRVDPCALTSESDFLFVSKLGVVGIEDRNESENGSKAGDCRKTVSE